MHAGQQEWKLTVVPDVAAMSDLAADVIARTIQEKPDSVLSLPTGSTPLPLFDRLVQRAAAGEIDFSRIEFFCLDDYLGLTPQDPNSLTGWLWQEFLGCVPIPRDNVHEVPAAASDPDAAALAYDAELSALGGLDLAVVGIGANAHVAFNEPGSPVDSRTRVVDLTPETVAQAAGYWGGSIAMPTRAMTIGIANLLEAKQIVLLASGISKAEALQHTLEGPIGPDVPASFLRLAESRLHVIADAEAASELLDQHSA
jgi:glucosamine-6-phosphate deaminase